MCDRARDRMTFERRCVCRVGVLIEAFMGRAHRAAVQLTVSIGALLLSLLQLWRIRDLSSTTAAVNSVTIDKAGILIQATIAT